jgi:hypothetical protein
MNLHQPVVIFLYIFAAISILFCGYACISLFRPLMMGLVTNHQLTNKRTTTVARKLLIYLHITQILQEIVLLPYVYIEDGILCRVIGFMHSYSGLSNIMATWLITLYSVNYISWASPHIDQFIIKYKETVCFLFPLITVVPLVMGDYGKHDAWCQLKYTVKKALEMDIVFYYIWMWMFTFFSVCILSVAVFNGIRSGAEWFIAKFIATNIGAYGIIAWTCSIPHTLHRILESTLSPRGNLLLTLPIYGAGILYGLLYVYNPSIADLPDKNNFRETELELNMSDLNCSFDNPIIRVSLHQQPTDL